MNHQLKNAHKIAERITGICACCMEETRASVSDESFPHEFGTEYSFEYPSVCCEDEILQAKELVNRVSYHTARKDHADTNIKKGDRYRSEFIKTLVWDSENNYRTITNYSKRLK